MRGVDLTTVQWYVDTALAKLLVHADELGDELVSRTPDLEGANSVYAIITHCCGVMEQWGGEVIAGRTIHRDRAGELLATGTVAQLEDLVRAQRVRWVRDLGGFDARALPRGESERDENEPEVTTQGHVAMHVVEELYQHLGQVDITADLLRRDAGR